MGAYSPPVITAAGLSIPAYPAYIQQLNILYQGIFGSSVYLGIDTWDYEFNSVLALFMADLCSGIQLAYNARSPQTAIGADLDAIGELLGISRLPAVNSNASLGLSGTAGTPIINGYAIDTAGNEWALPPLVTLLSGTTYVTATCTTGGPISANVSAINIIGTPTSGWTGVNNAAAANVGTPIETDSDYRARMAISTGIRSQTTLDATVAAIAAIPGVTRYNVLENVTGSTATIDGVSLTSHSIYAIVQGGTAAAIAAAIYNNRGIGCGMNGSTSLLYTDPLTGYQMTIYWDPPTLLPIYTSLTVNPLAGYSSATTIAIQTAITNYLNSLQIGELVSLAALYAVAMSVNVNISAPIFSITAFTLGTSASPSGTADITLTGKQVAEGITGHCIITT